MTLDELEALARAAQAESPRLGWYEARDFRGDQGPTDADFIAACSPERILALVAVVRSARDLAEPTYVDGPVAHVPLYKLEASRFALDDLGDKLGDETLS